MEEVKIDASNIDNIVEKNLQVLFEEIEEIIPKLIKEINNFIKESVTFDKWKICDIEERIEKDLKEKLNDEVKYKRFKGVCKEEILKRVIIEFKRRGFDCKYVVKYLGCNFYRTNYLLIYKSKGFFDKLWNFTIFG